MTESGKKVLLLLAILLVLVAPPLRRWAVTVTLSLLAALAAHRPVAWLCGHKVPRWAAIGLVLGGASALALLILVVIVERLCCAVGDLGPLFQDSGRMLERVEALLELLPDSAARLSLALLERVRQEGQGLLEQTLSALGKLGGRIFPALPGLFFRLFIVLLGAGYALADWERVSGFLRRRLPERWQRVVPGALRSLAVGAVGWLKTQGVLIAIQFGLLAVGFWILERPAPLLGALLVALADALPLIGAGLVLVPWGALLWLEGAGVPAAGMMLLWLLTWAVRAFLEPKLLGRRAGTNAFTSLVVLYLGLECFGVAGLLCAPVLLAAGMELTRSR